MNTEKNPINTLEQFKQENGVAELQKEIGMEVYLAEHMDCESEEPKYHIVMESKKVHLKRMYRMGDAGKSYEEFMGYGHKFKFRTFKKIFDHLTDEPKDYVKEVFHTNLGWDDYNGQEVFKYLNAVNESGEDFSSYAGDLELDIRGDLEKYKAGIKELVVPHAKLYLMYVAGVSSLITQKLQLDDTNIMLNVCGESSCGKTTAEMVALSFWGNPNKLKTSFNATENSMEELMLHRKIVPVVIDDILGAKNYSSENTKRQCISNSIFRFTSGKSKGRFGKTSDNYFCPVLISSETPLLEKLNGGESSGQFYRLLELQVKRGDLTKSSEHAKQIEKLIRWNYGMGAYELGKFMVTNGYDRITLEEMYDKHYDRISSDKRLERYQRFANRLAILSVTAELLNVGFDFNADIEALIDVIIDSVVKSISHKEFREDAYYVLKSRIEDNMHYFSKNRTDYISTQHVGAFDKDKFGNLTLCVETHRFAPLIAGTSMDEIIKMTKTTNEEVKMDTYNQNSSKFTSKELDSILDYWCEKGWLECRHGRQVKRTLAEKPGTLMYCVVL